MIRLDHISKSYDSKNNVVDDLSLEIEQGECLTLLGSSGSGKSTVLKMINRLIEPSQGTVFVNGSDIRQSDPVQLRRSIGYVFQGIGLFPHMTIRANVGIVPRLLNLPVQETQDKIEELLELLGLPLAEYTDRFPDELSGGQQQRVAVARALAGDPPCLLMDEPFGALDAITRDNIQQEFLALKQRLGKTVVFVTHDVLEALTLGDRIAVLNKGRLEQVGGGKELLNRPATPFVRDLLQKSQKNLDVFKVTPVTDSKTPSPLERED